MTAVTRGLTAAHAFTHQFATLDEVYDVGRAALSDGVRTYLEEGAGQEQTLADNRRAFDRWAIRPRALSGTVEPDTATTVLGIPTAAPVLAAPIGADGLFHSDGAKAIAAAAADCGVLAIVAEASTHSLEDYAEASVGPKIMQLHAWGAMREFAATLRRVEDAGYAAVCITVDCPTLGWREGSRRQRFDVTPCVISGNDVAGSGQVTIAQRLKTGLGSDWTWDTLAKARASTSLPVLVKGVLTSEDARRAVAAGADGVVVSNHGGRQLDGAPATLDQLPEVAAAVGHDCTVLLDGGIRRGLDVVKALALGADAVLLGRPVALGLSAAGPIGVAAVLALVVAELHRTLLLAGVGDLSGLDTSVLQRREGT